MTIKSQEYYKPKWLNLPIVTKVPLKHPSNFKHSHLKRAMERATIDRIVLVFRAKCFEIDNLWLFKMRVHISCPQSTAFHLCWCRKISVWKTKNCRHPRRINYSGGGGEMNYLEIRTVSRFIQFFNISWSTDKCYSYNNLYDHTFSSVCAALKL